MSSAPTAPRRRVRFRKPSKKTSLWLALVIIFLAFQVTARRLPPDGMTIVANTTTGTSLYGSNVGVVTTSANYSAAKYQTVINRLYDDFNTALPNTPPATLTTCGPLGYADYQVAFTWHGLPVEVWWNQGGCPVYTDSTGGIPNLLWAHTLSPADQQSIYELR